MHNDDLITAEPNENITTRNKQRKKSPRKRNTDDNDNKNSKRVVAVVGDSMIKHVKGFNLSNKKNKVVVKTFPGAKVECMKHYMIPTLEQNLML